MVDAFRFQVEGSGLHEPSLRKSIEQPTSTEWDLPDTNCKNYPGRLVPHLIF